MNSAGWRGLNASNRKLDISRETGEDLGQERKSFGDEDNQVCQILLEWTNVKRNNLGVRRCNEVESS